MNPTDIAEQIGGGFGTVTPPAAPEGEEDGA